MPTAPPHTMADSSQAQARRIALAAQGFPDPRPTGAVTRAAPAPGAGPDRAAADRLGQRAAAGALPAAVQPARALPDRPARPGLGLPARRGTCSSTGATRRRCCRSSCSRSCAGGWPRPARTPGAACCASPGTRPSWSTGCRDEVRDRGPVTAAEIEQDAAATAKPSNWGWNWSDTKAALEWLFWSGEVTAARRNGAFARLYDLTERVLPAGDRAGPDPGRGRGALRALVAAVRRGRSGWRPRSSCATTSGCRSPAFSRPRRAGRGGHAAAGHGAGLEAAGLPARRGPDPAPGATWPRWSARSTR